MDLEHYDYGLEHGLFDPNVHHEPDLQESLSYYHHAEPAVKGATYKKRVTDDYGHGVRNYQQGIYYTWVVDDDGKTRQHDYVYVDELLTADEVAELAPFCRCASCTSTTWIKPCACCCSCLKTVDTVDELSRTSQSVIDRTKAFRAANPDFATKQEQRRTKVKVWQLLLSVLVVIVAACAYVCCYDEKKMAKNEAAFHDFFVRRDWHALYSSTDLDIFYITFFKPIAVAKQCYAEFFN